jgi:hypothetical protein
MALIEELKELTLDQPVVHKPADCTFMTFHKDGNTYLQIDTYGSKMRKIVGKKSQSIQLGPRAIAQLRELLKRL